jgi:hypothetical protein
MQGLNRDRIRKWKKKKAISLIESLSVLQILKNSLTQSLPECNRNENEEVE